MTKEEKDTKLKELKAQAYDLIALKEQAQRKLDETNQQIGNLINTPVEEVKK